MKTDRELLELAAKAVGRAYVDGASWDDGAGWNPLEDDDDALRLAVQLHLVVDTNNCRAIRGSRLESGHNDWVYGDDDGDLGDDEATRHAIVRAAAAIGEGME